MKVAIEHKSIFLPQTLLEASFIQNEWKSGLLPSQIDISFGNRIEIEQELNRNITEIESEQSRN